MKKPVAYTDFVEFYTLEQYDTFDDELRKGLVALYASSAEKPKRPIQSKDDALVLGAICRGSRAWLGWSQKELAEKMNLCRTVIALIEKGNGNPRYTTVQKLMSVFEENGIKVIQDDKTFTLKIREVTKK
jgi:ribosome-binding protein aMBF1 (putative translation factor)